MTPAASWIQKASQLVARVTFWALIGTFPIMFCPRNTYPAWVAGFPSQGGGA